jgi:hypothetical protein
MKKKKIVKYLVLFLCAAMVGTTASASTSYGDDTTPSSEEVFDNMTFSTEEDNKDTGVNKNSDTTVKEEEPEDKKPEDDNPGENNFGNPEENSEENTGKQEDIEDTTNDEIKDEENKDENYGDYWDYEDNGSYEDYFDYTFEDFDGYVDSGYENYDWDYSDSSFDSLNGYGMEEKEKYVPGSKFLKTPKTIQYTLDSDSKYPKYIDTGIMVSDEKNIKIEDVKEVFRQIAVRKNAKFIEDTDKVMVLLDGKIVIAKGNVNNIETLKTIFKDTPIKITVQNTRAGGKFNLADYLERKGEIPIKVNGKKIKPSISPIIDNSKVLFPIKPIVEALGGKINWNGTKATITNGDKKITLTKDSDIAIVNGEEYLLSNPAKTDTKGNIMSLLNLVITKLGGEMSWNTTTLTLYINTPHKEVNLDEGL